MLYDVSSGGLQAELASSLIFRSSNVLICHNSLSDNNRAREALRQCLPEPLRDHTFSSVLRDDAATKRCLAQLLINLSDNVVDGTTGGAAM
jgi:CCR4-NOT transcription complex subunit 9